MVMGARAVGDGIIWASLLCYATLLCCKARADATLDGCYFEMCVCVCGMADLQRIVRERSSFVKALDESSACAFCACWAHTRPWALSFCVRPQIAIYFALKCVRVFVGNFQGFHRDACRVGFIYNCYWSIKRFAYTFSLTDR